MMPAINVNVSLKWPKSLGCCPLKEEKLFILGEQTVPKMKTRKAVKARFKVTAKGKLVRNRPGRRHILTKKSSKRKRSLRQKRLVDAGQTKMYARMMGVA